MKFQRFPVWLLICLAAFAGCKKADSSQPPPVSESSEPFNSSEPTAAQPRLPTIKLYVGPQEMNAEMAVSFKQIQTGMMFRTNMPEDDSMIFVLPVTQQAGFWMKNCSVPLSVAYIDPDGVIEEIHDLEPHNTNTVYSASYNIRFALETPQGWFKRHNIHQGMPITTEHGPLMQAFKQRP
jgi:uncharacterized membrane protein (UPF0127 family)